MVPLLSNNDLQIDLGKEHLILIFFPRLTDDSDYFCMPLLYISYIEITLTPCPNPTTTKRTEDEVEVDQVEIRCSTQIDSVLKNIHANPVISVYQRKLHPI